LFLIDNERFIRDFSVMRHLLAPLALFAFTSICSAVDQGRELIRDIITEEDLHSGIIANVRSQNIRAEFRKELLVKAPTSPKAVDAFLDSLELVLHVESIQEGHRLELSAVIGSINPKSKAFLLSQGVPEALIQNTAAVTGIKVDGVELKGDVLDAFVESLTDEDDSDEQALNKDESSLLNLVFDKEVELVVILGKKNPVWSKWVEETTAGQGDVRKRVEAVKSSIKHLVAIGMKSKGHSVALLVASGKIGPKVRAALLASGTPEAFIEGNSALLGFSIDNEQIKGDMLDTIAEGLKASRKNKAPPPALKSLADLSK